MSDARNIRLDQGSIVEHVMLAFEQSSDPVLSGVLDSLQVFEKVDSTNSYLLSQSILGSRAKVCIAESQLAGRGRRGNEWKSAPYKNIMLSLSWGFAQWHKTITALGLAVALIVAERLNCDYGISVKIKWPNDLLINGDKLAGLLVDVSGDANGGCNVVVGLGLNVHQPDWSQKCGEYSWCDLYSQGLMIDRNKLAGNLIADLIALFLEFEQVGFSPMVSRWNDLCPHVGEKIKLTKDGDAEVIEGVMRGVNDMGALIVDLEDQQRRIITDSSLSLRRV